MISPDQTLIRSGDLAKELGISVITLCRWTSEKDSPWRPTMFRRGWYLVPKLRAAGLLSAAPARVHQTSNLGVCDVG